MPELSAYQRSKGKQIQARLRKKSGNKTFRQRDAALEVLRLQRINGFNNDVIAAMLGVSTRMVRYYLTKHHRENTDLVFQNAEPEERFQRMLRWDIKAFEEWFLTFAPYDYFPQHARSWVEAFLRERNLMLNVPPGHAKSEFFMIWVPVWLICRDRNVQILMVSNSAEDAATWALEVAGQLEFNEGLVQAYGRFAPENTRGDQRWTPASGTFSVQGRTRKVRGAQFTMESRGMTGRILGRRADFILVDDPTKQEDAASEGTRKVQLDRLHQQVFSRLEPGGQIMVIGQRVHLLDLYGSLEKEEWVIGPDAGDRLWHIEKYPAVLRWPNEDPENPEPIVLWPERWPWEELQQAYANVGGSAAFEAMYQQNPSPEGSALVRKEWIEQCKDYSRPARVGPRGGQGENGFLPIVRVVSVDPSPTKFNGIVVGDLLSHKDNFVFSITEVIRMKAGQRELMAEVDRIIQSQQPDYFIFEESGFLAWVRDDPWFMGLKNRVKLLLHHTGVNKNHMEYGVQSLAGDFEFARISLPYGDETGRRMTDMLANEALMYPDGDTTDLLMALWFVKFNYRKLSPVRVLPTRIKGSTESGGWSWLKQIKSRKNAQDEAYRRWQKDKAKQREESRRVSVG